MVWEDVLLINTILLTAANCGIFPKLIMSWDRQATYPGTEILPDIGMFWNNIKETSVIIIIQNVVCVIEYRECVPNIF